MSDERLVMALLAEGNPATEVPEDLRSDLSAPSYLAETGERSIEVSKSMTATSHEQRRRPAKGPWLLVAALVAVLGVGAILINSGGDGPATGSPDDRATRFWQAVVSGDRDAAYAEVEPEALASGVANLFGRAGTLEGQFDWYEAVGWQWELGECVERSLAEVVECTATARNSWSQALGVEPVTGIFEFEFGETGITAITDQEGSFISQWSEFVFEPFANWVAENHPDDADLMFDFTVDVNPEILDQYRINTERFVEAH